MNLYTINALQPLVIGRQDDNLVMEIRFDCAVWSKENPALTDFRLEITSPKGIKYIPAEQRMDGSVLVWTITNTDTAVAGEGEYEIIATGAGGEQQASAHAKLYISDRAAGTPGVMPDYEKPLLDQMAEYAQRAEDAAEKAESTGGLPDNSVPAQMLVSDGVGGAYWASRLAYDYRVTDILPETTLAYNSGARGYLFFTDALSEVVIGKAYMVIIDNKYIYVGIARRGVYGGMPCIGFGNPYIFPLVPGDAPLEEPWYDQSLSFAVIFPPAPSEDGTANGIFALMPGAPTENITLSIHLCAQRKLDKRFLPDDIGGGSLSVDSDGNAVIGGLSVDADGNAVI